MFSMSAVDMGRSIPYLANRLSTTPDSTGRRPLSENGERPPDVSHSLIVLPCPVAARAGMRAAFAIALGLVTAALAAPFGVGLVVVAGHIAVCAALALGRATGRPLGIAAGCAALTALLLVEPVVPLAFLFGVSLGSIAWKLSFWEQMEFLDDARPLSRLRHQIDEAMNVFIRNDATRWDRMYAHGQWEFLHGPTLAPLYSAAAEFLRLRAPTGVRVVDLGCGNGALLPVLRGWHRGYMGIDLSSEAVAHCLSRLRLRCRVPGRRYALGEEARRPLRRSDCRAAPLCCH